MHMKDGDDHEAGARQGEGAALDPQKGGALLKPFPGGYGMHTSLFGKESTLKITPKGRSRIGI